MCEACERKEEGVLPECAQDHPDFDWLALNRVLRDGPFPYYCPEKNTLVQRADVIQSVLRHSVVSKMGDRGTVSPHVSIATYYIMTETPFDAVDFIFHYIQRMLTVRRSASSLKQNVALGSMFAFLLKGKYGLISSDPTDAAPEPFTNGNFNVIWPSGSRIDHLAHTVH